MNIKRKSAIGLLLVAFTLPVFMLNSCSYQDRVAPLELPEASSRAVTVDNGLKLVATAFVSKKSASDAFGFDIRKAGLLPVQVTFQNDGSKTVTVVPEQTFLVDNKNEAWPVASLDRTYERTKGYVEVGETLSGAAKPATLLGVAGAVAGMAVAIISGKNVGEGTGKGAVAGAALGALIGGASRYDTAKKQIRSDLAGKTLQNEEILPGQIAYGVLFFPGLPAEAQSAKELRLALTVDGTRQIVRLPLNP